MLDIKFVRSNPEAVKQNIKNKFQDEKLPLVDEVLELDQKNRDIKQEVDVYKRQDLDYNEVKSLRIEAKQKLTEMRPSSIGQASRISGVSPADISVLLVYLESR